MDHMMLTRFHPEHASGTGLGLSIVQRIVNRLGGAVDCIAHEPGSAVSRVFVASQTIEGSWERPVQVALDDVPSNIVQVYERPIAQETLIYQAVLQHISNRAFIVRGETAAGFDEDTDPLLVGVESSLLQDYLAVNTTPYSLRFLFQSSNVYFVQSEAAIARDYLRGDDPQQACAQFRSDYPMLDGIISLSRIGMNDDGAQALVHVLHECGPDDRQAAYYMLTKVDDGWQVTNTNDAPTISPASTREPSA
jgi:hypothetical protein